MSEINRYIWGKKDTVDPRFRKIKFFPFFRCGAKKAESPVRFDLLL